MASTINATPTSSGLISSADNSGVLALQTGGTTAVTVDASQNVGIGTASPSYKLSVAGSTGFTSTEIKDNTDRAILGWHTSDGFRATVIANKPMVFATNDTERMRIDSSGRLLIATSSSIDNDYTMQLAVATANGFITKPTTNKTYNAAGFRNSSNSEVGYISCTSSATSFGTSSDYRLKHDIAPMVNALNKVAKLKPVIYKWNVDNSEGEGFIAHELQEVCPLAVTGKKDAVNEDGSIKAQGIDTSFLVATLTAAIQELNAKVTALEEQVINLGVK